MSVSQQKHGGKTKSVDTVSDCPSAGGVPFFCSTHTITHILLGHLPSSMFKHWTGIHIWICKFIFKNSVELKREDKYKYFSRLVPTPWPWVSVSLSRYLLLWPGWWWWVTRTSSRMVMLIQHTWQHSTYIYFTLTLLQTYILKGRFITYVLRDY